MELSDSSAAIGGMIEALETEHGTSQPAPGEGEKGGEPAKEGAPENLQPPKKEEPETPDPNSPEALAKAEAEKGKALLPPELEPYKDLIKAKGWDTTKPNWHIEAVKSLQELQALHGRHTTDRTNTLSHASALESAILGDPSAINEIRQRHGAAPLPFDATSLDDKIKSAEEEMATWTAALSVDDEKSSAAAIEKIHRALSKKLEDLRLEKAIAAKMPAKPQAANLAVDARTNFSKLVQKDPKANEVMYALAPFLKSKDGVGILGAFGMNAHNILSTPEMAEQALELATRLHMGDPAVFKAEVEKRVKEEMEKNGNRRALSSIPGGSPAASPSNNKPGDEAVADHLKGMEIFQRR